MDSSDGAGVTALLNRSRHDEQAREQVFQMVYGDLRRLARRQLQGGKRDQTLSATALINEAYLKLMERSGNRWNDRQHFLRVAAKAMRQVTIDLARQKTRLKRGGPTPDLPLDEQRLATDRKPEMILAIEEGLALLANEQPRWVEVVELRFFGGLTAEEAGAALGVSLSSVNRDWAAARAWLRDFLMS